MTAMRLKRYPSPSGGFALGKMGVGTVLLLENTQEEKMYKEMLQGYFNHTLVDFDMTLALGYEGDTPTYTANQWLFSNQPDMETFYGPMVAAGNYMFANDTALKTVTIKSCNKSQTSVPYYSQALTDLTLTGMTSARILSADYTTVINALPHTCTIHCSDGKDVAYINGSWQVVN